MRGGAVCERRGGGLEAIVGLHCKKFQEVVVMFSKLLNMTTDFREFLQCKLLKGQLHTKSYALLWALSLTPVLVAVIVMYIIIACSN